MAGLAPPAPKSGARAGAPASHAPPKRDKRKPPDIRPKMRVSSPNDPEERAADRAADRVMRSAAASFPQGARGHEEKVKKNATRGRDEVKRATKPDVVGERDRVKRAATRDDERRTRTPKTANDGIRRAPRELQGPPEHRTPAVKGDEARRATAPSAESGAPEIPSGFEASLGRQSGGSLLPGSTQQLMESGFGRSFGDVRMHADGGAGALSDSIGARAFTLGNDVFFAAGQYQPHTSDGRRLIAHELAHVTQQHRGEKARPTLWRQPTSENSAAPVATGPDPATSPGAPTEPSKEFVGTGGTRIVREPVERGGKEKKGTFYLPALMVPTIEDAPKGVSNHSLTALQGRPRSGGVPLRQGEPAELVGKTERGALSARRTWIAAAQADQGLQSSLTDAVKDKFGSPTSSPSGDVTPATQAGQPYLRLTRTNATGNERTVLVGTPAEIAHHELVVLPTWNKQGQFHKFDVDHLHELQLGGLDGWENFWVLDEGANRSSGSLIQQRLKSQVQALIDAADAPGNDFWRGAKPSVAQVMEGWVIHCQQFQSVDLGGDARVYWTRPEVAKGDQLVGLRAMTDQEVTDAGLVFRPGTKLTFLNVFTTPYGGAAQRLEPQGTGWAATRGRFFEGLTDVRVDVPPFESVEEGRKVGTLRAKAFERLSKKGKIFTVPEARLDVFQSARLGFGLYSTKAVLDPFEMKQTSPVAIDDAGLSALGVMFVEGRILASIPLFQGTEIPFEISGDRLTVSFPIPSENLHLGPVQVTDAALEMSANPDGLILGGGVGFAVQGLGTGRVEARQQVGGGGPTPSRAPAAGPAGGGEHGGEIGFVLDGSFAFDTDKLDPATIGVRYENHQFTVDAEIGVKQGSIRGIESARIHVRSGPDGILVDGVAILAVPGLRGTQLEVRRADDGTLDIGADGIPLPASSIPGIRGATANIHATRNAETGDWTLAGGGTADVAIAGLTGQLTIDVRGPYLSIAGRDLALRRGPLEGSGELLVTNRPRDPAGNPTEGDPVPLAASGHAEASLPLGRHLRGTVGGTILPNGELEFTGGLQLPPTVDLFDRRELERVLFRPPSLDIPIFGITAAGQRIGIFATIGGSLTFVAGIGPGQIRDAALTASFNPDHPESTTVHGTANFVLPADAGLRLEIHGGIGAGIPIVSAEAGIEVGGKLGVATEASLPVQIDWTPQRGLSVDATAHVEARPQFALDISAYVKVSADVLISEFELYSKHWNLAQLAFGPELAIAVDFPVGWTETNGLDFDVNRITFEPPEIDFRAFGAELMSHLVDR